MTPKQIGYVRGLLAKAQLDEAAKEQLVRDFTNNRTTHLSEMTQPETQLLIRALGGGIESPKDKMVRKILSMAHEMGWEEHTPGANGKRKVDMERLNAWCRKHTRLHTDLDDIPYRELPEVVTAFERVYSGFLKAF